MKSEYEPLMEEKPVTRSDFLRRTGLIVGGLVIGGSALSFLAGCSKDSPEETHTIDPLPQETTPTNEETPEKIEPQPRKQKLTNIRAASPERVIIPSVGINAICASAIKPEIVERRHNQLAYNPPTLSDTYWFAGCALPQVPSRGTTYIAGHSDTARSHGGAVFDRLPKVENNERITLFTNLGKAALGRFDYAVQSKTHVPYDDLDSHTKHGEFGDGSVKDRLVLITCHIPDEEREYGYNTVVVAQLDNATTIKRPQ